MAGAPSQQRSKKEILCQLQYHSQCEALNSTLASARFGTRHVSKRKNPLQKGQSM